jgi:hypothetical protein
LGKACEANLVGLLEYAIHNVRVMIQQLKMAAAIMGIAAQDTRNYRQLIDQVRDTNCYLYLEQLLCFCHIFRFFNSGSRLLDERAWKHLNRSLG